MTKAERTKLTKALNDLMANEDEDSRDFTRGIGAICELLGMRYPAYHDTKGLRSVGVHELMQRGESEFRFPGDGK